MVYNLSNEFDLRDFNRRVHELVEKRAVVELSRRCQRRTLKQNAYLHVIISFFAFEYGCSADEAKVDFFKKYCNHSIFCRERINRKGRTVNYLRSSSELSTAELTTAIERFRNWSAAEAGIYLPAPEERGYLLYAEKQIERDKDFL